jgi:hypothetical protein
MSDGFNTPFVNIDELHRQKKDKLERRYAIYEKILKLCHNKIKQIGSQPDNMGFCFYSIPSYIYGIPLYDTNSCVMYIVKSLVDNGFDVKYTHPRLLWISWFEKTNQNSVVQVRRSLLETMPSLTTSAPLVIPKLQITDSYSQEPRRITNSSDDGISEIDRKILNIIRK